MPDRLTAAQLNELERLEKAATPGPWQHKAGVLKHYVFSLDAGEDLGFSLQELSPLDGHEVPAEANASLIAAARNALPDLITDLHDARAERDAMRAVVEAATKALIRLGASEDREAVRADGKTDGEYALAVTSQCLKVLDSLTRTTAERDAREKIVEAAREWSALVSRGAPGIPQTVALNRLYEAVKDYNFSRDDEGATVEQPADEGN